MLKIKGYYVNAWTVTKGYVRRTLYRKTIKILNVILRNDLKTTLIDSRFNMMYANSNTNAVSITK